MKYRFFALTVAALLLIISSWFGLSLSNSRLTIRSWEKEGMPLLFIAPKTSQPIPGVLVAHGFAGSKQLMQGYAYTFARAGYGVLLWDFKGHGANPKSLNFSSLQPDLNLALAAIKEQPEIDSSRLALLGHSMGSGAAMTAGIERLSEFQAIIAVSPTGANVTPQAPRNLQLQAGSWEPRFVENAKRLLQQAGGEKEGRSLVIVPNVEHITILFNRQSHQQALNWLDRAFNLSSTSNYVDLRMAWYALHLTGWLVLLKAIASNKAYLPQNEVKIGKARIGLLLAPIAATGTTLLISRGVDLGNLGGIMVGGAIALWLGVAGLVWLGAINKFPRPNIAAILWGIGAFLILWMALGAMGQVVWLQWCLIPHRLWLWLLISLTCLPWFLAAGIAQEFQNTKQRIWWWLGQTVAVVVGLIATVLLLPKLGFIFLLIPIFPLIFAMFSFTAAQFRQPWSNAVASTCLFGWAIASAFPLSS